MTEIICGDTKCVFNVNDVCQKKLLHIEIQDDRPICHSRGYQ